MTFWTRKALRHALLRRRNERIATSRDDRMPVLLRLAPIAVEDILLDPDAGEQFTLDFEGRAFMGIPLLADPAIGRADVGVEWPA